MAKVDLKISFECPACKQIDADVSFSKAIEIDTVSEEFGTGRYGDIERVTVTCTGCKAITDIDF